MAHTFKFSSKIIYFAVPIILLLVGLICWLSLPVKNPLSDIPPENIHEIQYDYFFSDDYLDLKKEEENNIFEILKRLKFHRGKFIAEGDPNGFTIILIDGQKIRVELSRDEQNMRVKINHMDTDFNVKRKTFYVSESSADDFWLLFNYLGGRWNGTVKL